MGATASRSSSRGRETKGREGREGGERREELAPSQKARGREGTAAKGLSNGRNDPSLVPEVLGRLTRVQPGKHRVVTCYLKLEPRDRSRGKYLIKVKNRVKDAVQGLPRLGLERAAADEVLRDLDRIQQFLRASGNLPSTQGLAVFACEGIELFETVPLPVVHRSRLAINGSALVH